MLTPNAKIDDGLFDVFLYTGHNVYRFVYYMLRLFLHFHLNFSDTVRFRVKKLELQSDGRVLYQGDGDLFGQLPLKITMIPSALEIAGAHCKKKSRMKLKLIEKIKEKSKPIKQK